MPKLLKVGPYRFLFYSDVGESRHMCTWSVTMRKRNSGLRRRGSHGVEGSDHTK